MTEEQSASVKITQAQRIEELEGKVVMLTRVIAKLSHYAGTQNHLNEFGIEKWVPGKEDMTRWK